MKRLWITLLAFVVVMTCFSMVCFAEDEEEVDDNIISFGHYKQDTLDDTGDDPIEWIILEETEDQALLISLYAIDVQQYNNTKGDVNWADSSIRKWLNSSFLKSAFTEDEQKAILKTKIKNKGNGYPDWDTNGGKDTEDRVFLLSFEEAKSYPDLYEFSCYPSDYASANGADGSWLSYEAAWWLRSSGKKQNEAAYLFEFDSKLKAKSDKVTDKKGVRPAIWVDLNANWEEFPYAIACDGFELLENEKYEEATAVFESLGDYWCSDAMVDICAIEPLYRDRDFAGVKEIISSLNKDTFKYYFIEMWYYDEACQVKESGDYETAANLFATIKDYEDSNEQWLECKYDLAISYQDARDYQTAIELYKEIGQYKDSVSRLKKCFDDSHINVYYFNTKTVNAGKNKGFSESNAIGTKDRHAKWNLGRFFVAGFTSVIDGGTDSPIILKTPGDAITLYFELEQNIDALNGNDKLSISVLKKGSDHEFSVPETYFGRGTLLVRTTDYQNAKKVEPPYVDYLQANYGTGADTVIVFREEGDYEIALDYQVKSSDLKDKLDPTSDYSIRFKFSVRNGSTMFYPFDVITGSELQNTSITENGFFIDLARSKSLDINVKRTELIEQGAGYVEDERFNRAAREGDRYTQEGIYTISVKNRYTGESTTKTIFVGSEELLEKYIQMGFSESRLK